MPTSTSSSAAATIFRKLFAAFAAAKATKGRPTVILAKTKKGYGMGGAGESRMTAHQAKKLDTDALKAFRDRFALPLTDAQVEGLEFYKPDENSRELRYLRERRERLGGFLPKRRRTAAHVAVPDLSTYAGFALEADGKEMSTTTAAVRLFSSLIKHKELGPRVVPIVADEARTFGMANLFRQVGIYSPLGQLYEPEDAGSMLYYKESRDGQLLEEGITEAGAISSWAAAATSYSVHGLAMLPFYIYYSMFGFQRVGDLIWAAADQRARGFLIGATAGRTTLGGEGLQHQDGSSHLVAATIPNCRAYDPAFAYEMAVILDHGARDMMERDVDAFYYVTAMNENYAQPSMPDGVRDGIIRGCIGLPATEMVSRLFASSVQGDPAGGHRCGKAARRGMGHRRRGPQRHQLQRTRPRGPRDRAVEPPEPRFAGKAQPRRGSAVRLRTGRRRHRLRSRLPAADRDRDPGSLRDARHRRLRPQRHPQRAARLLRGRPAPRRGGSARGARRRGPARPGEGGGGGGPLRDRPEPAGALDGVRNLITIPIAALPD